MSLPFHIDLYAILKVSKSTTQNEIKKAYRKLVLQHHPDKENGSDYDFQILQQAYKVLSNPNLRKLYDQQKDPKQQILASLNRLAYLLKHTLIYGSLKNLLLILLASTVMYTAGWWGGFLAVLTVISIVLSARSWFQLNQVQ